MFDYFQEGIRMLCNHFSAMFNSCTVTQYTYPAEECNLSTDQRDAGVIKTAYRENF